VGHGTDSGYQRHIKAGEPPCRPCKDAHAAYMRSYHRQAAKAALSLPQRRFTRWRWPWSWI
jgi:hypothetical protein